MLALCRAGLLKHLPAAPERAKEEFRSAPRRVRANHGHIGEAQDLPFELGCLSIQAGDQGGALAYFKESRALHGESEATTHILDLCRRHLAPGGEG
jgi:hypothetical protein